MFRFLHVQVPRFNGLLMCWLASYSPLILMSASSVSNMHGLRTNVDLDILSFT